MLMVKRFCWLIPTFLTVVLFAAGCGAKNEGKPGVDAQPKDEGITPEALREAARSAGGDPDAPTPPQPSPPSVAEVKADVIMTAEQLLAENEKDWNFVFTKHKGKVIEVSGIVDSVGGASDMLSMKAGPAITDTVLCPMREAEPWTKVFPGQFVVLRARVADPFKWEIIEVKGPKPEEFSANELARLMMTMPEEIEKKLRGKCIIVSGIVGMVSKDESGHVKLFLKTEDPEHTISCRFVGSLSDGRQKKRNEQLKTGLKLKCVGYFGGTAFSTTLSFCEILEISE